MRANIAKIQKLARKVQDHQLMMNMAVATSGWPTRTRAAVGMHQLQQHLARSEAPGPCWMCRARRASVALAAPSTR